MNNYLTIDVGGTNIKFACMNEQLEITGKGEIPTPKGSLEAFENALVEIYKRFSDKGIKALCMSAPGKIDSSSGYFYTSGALGYISGVNLPERMKERIPVPISVENDAKAAALAELWKGAMKGYQSGSVMTLGTGIGGSLILDGKLVRGNTFAAGEFSTISTRWDIEYDRDKRWAATASTRALTDMYADALGCDPSQTDGRAFFEAANSGDQTALDVLERFSDSLVCGIVSLQLILDLQRFVIGGGISRQPILFETINRKLDEIFEKYKGILPASRPEVVPCRFGNDANMIGALYHYLYE